MLLFAYLPRFQKSLFATLMVLMKRFYKHLPLLLVMVTLFIVFSALRLQTPDDATVAMTLYNQGRLEEAEKAFRVLVLKCELLFGKEHPETLAQKNNLANTLTSAGLASEGEKMHRQVLAIREKLFGAEQADTISSRNNLATALQAQGKNTEAETEFRTVLVVRERIFGRENPDVLKTCYALALCLELQTRYTEAFAFATRAETGMNKVWGANHPVTMWARGLRERIEGNRKL